MVIRIVACGFCFDLPSHWSLQNKMSKSNQSDHNIEQTSGNNIVHLDEIHYLLA